MKKFLMLAGVLASLGVPLANATVEVRVSNGAAGDSGWMVCGGTTCVFTGAVGNYSFTLDSAVQNNSLNPLLDMTYQANSTNSNPGTLVIEAIANGYTVSSPGTQLAGSGNSSLGDQITFASYGGNNNTTCASGINGCHANNNGALLASIGPLDDNAGFNSSANGGGTSVNPYELGIYATFASPTNGGTLSGDLKINAVPEPASVALLGGVMLFAVSTIRRKMRRTV
jgi:hypothetical protein